MPGGRSGAAQAAELLADVLATHRGKILSGYMPMRTEIDPLPAMAAHQGPVCVPVIVAAGPITNFLVAIVILAGFALAYGTLKLPSNLISFAAGPIAGYLMKWRSSRVPVVLGGLLGGTGWLAAMTMPSAGWVAALLMVWICPAACQEEPDVSSLRSSNTTSFQPNLAR